MVWTTEAFDKGVAEFLDQRREEVKAAGGPGALSKKAKKHYAAETKRLGINAFPPTSREYMDRAIAAVSAKQRYIELERRDARQALNQLPTWCPTTRVSDD